MRALVKKYQSQQGASILLALAVVLVCTMVAAVVLVAAAANAGKGVSAQNQSKSYYAVASAAQLIADDLKRTAPSAALSTTTKSYACQSVHPTYTHADANIVSNPQPSFSASGTTALTQLMEEAFCSIDPATGVGDFSREFTIEADGLQSVNDAFFMDSEYNINIELSASPDDGSYGYAMVVHVPSVRGEAKEQVTTLKNDTHLDGWEWDGEGGSVSWIDENMTPINPVTGNHEPASNEYGHGVEQSYEVTTTTISDPITWGSPSFSKGRVE